GAGAAPVLAPQHRGCRAPPGPAWRAVSGSPGVPATCLRALAALHAPPDRRLRYVSDNPEHREEFVMLRISVIGHLGADAEVRESRQGAPIVDFRVAVNQVRIADGTRQENTEWFSIRVMGRQTEYAQRLTRGSRVFVAGRLDVRHYRS